MSAETKKLSDSQRALLIRAVECTNADRVVRIHGRGETASYAILARLGFMSAISFVASDERSACGARSHQDEKFASATEKARKLVATWRCGTCGHVQYHCPAGGCNHYDKTQGEDGMVSGWCGCEAYVPAAVEGAAWPSP